MNIKHFITAFIYVVILTLSFSCSKDDDDNQLADTRSFTTNTTTDYFINRDGTVNLIVSGTFQDDANFGNVTNRGFVYGTSSNPEVDTNNTSVVGGISSAATGYIEGLTSGETYYIRGYFEYDDGTFFYGNEIQASTDIDASASRDLTLAIESDAFLIQTNFITVTLNINDVIKEMPVEFGVEYSVNSDFTNSITNEVEGFNGVHNEGIILTTSYSAVAEPLTAGTLYYFRPYAKYADNTITNGGTSTASFTTNSVDNRIFTINSDIDYFINIDGAVNLIVSGTFQDDVNFGNVTNRGFVFGTSTKPEVSNNNTSNAGGSNSATTGYIENLTSGQVYYVRGYFEMSDGSYFYGNEIQASTAVDASTTRTITMEIESTPFFISQTEITPKLNLSNVTKEVPKEIGYEYSVNSDFSTSVFKEIANYSGIHNKGILTVTSYASELITGLNTSTIYYFRPYAKYADNTVTNGGVSTASFTTN